MPRHPVTDRTILETALIGFQYRLAQVEEAILKIRRQIRAGARIPLATPAFHALSDGMRPTNRDEKPGGILQWLLGARLSF